MKILQESLQPVFIEDLTVSGTDTVYTSETIRVLGSRGGTLFVDISGTNPSVDIYLEYQRAGDSVWYSSDPQGDPFIAAREVSSPIAIPIPANPGLLIRLKFVGTSANGTANISISGVGYPVIPGHKEFEPSPNFVDSGALKVSVIGKPYDSILDAARVVVINPWHIDETGPEHIISETNIDASEGDVVRDMALGFVGYRKASFEFLCSGGVTMTLWASNNPEADINSDVDWIDITENVFGVASITDSHALGFFDGKVNAFRIHYVVSSPSTENTVDAWVYRGQ